jgi:hypothetical protein
MTGLLKEQTEETPKKYVDHSVEESTTRSSDKMSSDESTTRRTVHKITETEIVFPVEIIQTKVYGNNPTKLYIGDEHVQKQLSQSSTLLLFLLATLVFCTFLLATTIAVVSSFRDEKFIETYIKI